MWNLPKYQRKLISVWFASSITLHKPNKQISAVYPPCTPQNKTNHTSRLHLSKQAPQGHQIQLLSNRLPTPVYYHHSNPHKHPHQEALSSLQPLKPTVHPQLNTTLSSCYIRTACSLTPTMQRWVSPNFLPPHSCPPHAHHCDWNAAQDRGCGHFLPSSDHSERWGAL